MVALTVIDQAQSGTSFWHALEQFGVFGAALLAIGPLAVFCWATPIAKSADVNQTCQRRRLWPALIISCVPILICLYATCFRRAHATDFVADWRPMPVYAGVLIEVVAASFFVRESRRVWPVALGAVVVSLFATMFVSFISLCLIGGDGP